MHPRAADFQECAARRYDFEVDVHEFPEGTKTARDAAAAVGCDLAQIASGIVFAVDDDIVVVMTSGANHVVEEKLADVLDADVSVVSMADAAVVKERLGWSIGGVPPFCHERTVPVFMDESLTGFEVVWAAAGTPTAVFPIPPGRLQVFADATVADIATPRD